MDPSSSILFSLGAWSWFVVGLALMALELIAPGTIFLWFGLAALFTGAIALQIGIGWQAQLALFAAFAVASLVAQRLLRRRFEQVDDNRGLNERAGRHVGRRFVLAEPIVSGSGKVHIDDSVWRLSGPDLPAGTEVVVTAVDGATLAVERA
jgi:membrane protein implicated in regulation of membrane protease activity